MSIMRPSIAQVPLSPCERTGVGVVTRGGGEVGGAAPTVGVSSVIPGRVERERGGPVDELLQHLLARYGQSSSLGDGLRVGLDGLVVGVAEDGRQETGSQGR